MTGGSWSLRRRIALAFGATSCVLVTALALLQILFLVRGAERELDALFQEEIEETEGRLASIGPASVPDERAVLEMLGRVTAIMRGQPSDRPQAWRLWRAVDGTLLGEFGDAQLLALVPTRPDAGAAARGLRWRVAPFARDYRLGLAMDGRERMAEVRAQVGEVVAFALLATLVAFLAGLLLARRVTGDLEAVARAVRVEGADEFAPLHDAPLELVAVVRALQDTLKRVRAEIDHGRLITSGMAHELRSPLQNLMGEAQVALLRERSSSEYRAVLESQLEELNELSRVVDNLVTLSSVEAGRRPITIERFDLAAELRLRLTREARLAQRRGVQLLLTAEGPHELEGDREALVLALRNVVTNAIEWTPRGKEVVLTLAPVADELEIVVEDAGPGIPPEEREAIFRPFHRGQAAVGRRVGFGIGLALTHRAVSDQGGRIEVTESRLGGASFRIVLPRRRRED